MAEEQHAVLIRHLKTAQQFTRTPKRLTRTFKTTSDLTASECEDTGRIFLEVGFRAWLAYFLATNAVNGTLHYQGKANDVTIISNVQKDSVDNKKVIAKGVCEERLDGAVTERVEAWENHCGYRNWLQKQQGMAHSDSDDSGEIGNPNQSHSSLQDPHSHSSVDSHRVSQDSQSRTQAAVLPQEISLFAEATLVQQMPSATISGVMELFPPYICGAILKDRVLNVAMVQMSFPSFPSDDCLMTLTIQPNKVEYLAMALFGIHLESEGEQRYIVMDNGARAVPSNEMSLEGAGQDSLVSMFGPLISTAIQNSWKRTLEIGNAIRKTKCVSMNVSTKADVPAYLGLWLWLEKGLELRQILYA